MEIKVYVANLGKYNEGELVGDWFTLPCDLEEIYVQIGVGYYDEEGEYHHGVVEVDNHGWEHVYEEWAIHDYEAPEGLEISEYSSLSRLNELAEEIEYLKDYEIEEIEYLLMTGNYDLSEAIEKQREGGYRIYTNCDDMSDVAYQRYEESGALQELEQHICSDYIDWARIGRDIETSSSFYYIGQGTYLEVF